MVPRGLEVLGAVVVSEQDAAEGATTRAGDFAFKLRHKLRPGTDNCSGIIAAVATPRTIDNVQYSWYKPGDDINMQSLEVEIIKEGLWKDTTLLRCQMQLSLPLYTSSSATASGNRLL